jgi:hypothetical protein
MGSIESACCRFCGYKKEKLFMGGGMSNFTFYDGKPALDKENKELIIANYFEKDKIEKEGKIIFYDSKELYTESQVKDIFHDDEILNNIFLCPKCNQFEMIFKWVGCWD